MPRPHGIPDAQWRDWVWQMQERVRSAKELERYVNPTDDERRAIDALAERFRFVITPYYASLMDPQCPIRRQVVPRTAELDDPAGVADPLDEVAHSPVKNVIRVYPDRIAFCVNNKCALYCRFCLRKRMVGDEEWIMKKREPPWDPTEKGLYVDYPHVWSSAISFSEYGRAAPPGPLLPTPMAPTALPLRSIGTMTPVR